MRSRQLMWLGAGFTALLLTVGGCQSAHVAHPLTERLAANDEDAQMEFWHSLADRHVASNDEAFHGLLLFLDGKDPARTYNERVAIMKSRRLLPTGFYSPADEGVQRGPLAYSVVRALSIKGGWVLHVFGTTERYALRELVDLGLFPESSPNQTFSGSEFLGIIGKIEDYQQQHSAGLARG